ncbi:MAG: hypothetical protein U9N79_07545 [Actinomycetota bacterium]|nr:hypothetical protein [Actinomycetota bacterium]
MRIVLAGLSSVGAVVFLIVGGVAMKWYLWDVAIGQVGESDRSMLFWGIPILFIGVFAAVTGLVLIVVAIRGFRFGS